MTTSRKGSGAFIYSPRIPAKMGKSKSKKPMNIFGAEIKSILFPEYIFYPDNKTRLALY